MLRKLLLIVPLLFPACLLFGQRSLDAVKSVHAPVIDGNLGDSVWQTAPLANDFIQNFPNFGQPGTVKTEVRILYDNEAVYIGAYLYDNPASIRRQITARDGEQRQDVDYFAVFFDTYNDQQNGFVFLVTSANVQSDAKLNPTSSYSYGDFGDKSWDAVWQSRTTMQNNGWIVEMRIPYISLRFADKDIQTWGLQYLRFTRTNNETSFWNPTDPNVNGFINQFGKYRDLRNIKPPLRLSFSPYISGGVRFNPPGNAKEKEILRNGGLDVKYGINESFTLDMTLIPDFGQVVSDNVINNLSPFEVQFQENRPFFTEGTELFNKSGLFYSRRIGDIPVYHDSVLKFISRNPSYELLKNPSTVQLYNGVKFSGRTSKRLGIGVFNAITAPMNAKLHNNYNDKDTTIRTEPLTNYNIIVLDQALKGRSSLTFTNTNVMRQGAERDANVSALDWSLYSKGNNYRFNGYLRYSKIFGNTLYNGSITFINDTIRKDGKLFIKPYDGFNSSFRFGKVSGNLLFNTSVNIESDQYDPNDLGYLPAANEVVYNASVSYQELTPKGIFLNYRHSINGQYTRLYKPDEFSRVEMWYTGFLFFRNFWDITFNLGGQPKSQRDFFELRTPGRFLKRPTFYYVSFNGSSDSRKRLFVSMQAGYTKSDVENGDYFLTGGGARFRFSNRFSLSLDAVRQHDHNQIGYAFMREPSGEPIIGYRRNTELTTVLSGIYNFTPRLNLTLRGRHYWNKVHYRSFYNVDMNGEAIPRAFINDQDYNFNLFNVDAFVTWDFRLGSRVIFGWKNWLADSFGTDLVRQKTYMQNLDKVFSLAHGNEFSLKLIYFLDYNQLTKKK